LLKVWERQNPLGRLLNGTSMWTSALATASRPSPASFTEGLPRGVICPRFE
jgi:hypothetical protein